MATMIELTGKPHLSYSSLNTYLSCGEKYRLLKIEKIPQKPAVWLVGGTAVHTGTEVFDRARHVDGRDLDESISLAVAAFHKVLNDEKDKHPLSEWSVGGRATKANPDKENFIWWSENGEQQVRDYAEWREANPQYTLWEGPAGIGIEYPFESTFAGQDTPTHGFIDRLFTDQVGNLHVVDIKSGSRTPSDVTQLAVYATAIEEETGIRPQFGSYYMTRTAYLTAPVDLNRWNKDMLGPWLRVVREDIENGRFIPRLSMECGYCSVADSCYAKNPNVAIPTHINLTGDNDGN